MKRIILKIIVASLLFLGLLPMLIAWRENYLFQAVLFLLSVICYAIAEIMIGSKQVGKREKKVRGIANMLFLAVLFLALGILVHRWISAAWTGELQIGFLMLSATYYSITLMQLCFLGEESR